MGTRVTQANRKTRVRPASKILSAISFGVFWRSAPSTSAIMRSRKDSPGLAVMRTTMRSDKNFRAAGDRRAIAAAFANDWRGFAGDRGFIDRSDALNHIAVARNHFPCFDDNGIPFAQYRRRYFFFTVTID